MPHFLLKSLLNSSKLLLAAGLIYWAVSSGKLNLQSVYIFSRDPEVGIYCFLTWLFAGVIFASLRWQSLVKGMKLSIQLQSAIQLTLIGSFFNSFLLGATGGDFVKAYYIYKGQAKEARLKAIFTLLLDRLFGLYAVFLISTIMILGFGQDMFTNPSLAPFIYFVLVFFVCLNLGLFLAVMPFSDAKDPFLRLFAQVRILNGSLPHKLYVALRSYRDQPRSLLVATFYSICCQVIFMSIYVYITYKYHGYDVTVQHFAGIATILPMGFLLTALPIAPGGLGVGHVAFDHLYQLLGIEGGANIFNTIFISQILCNLVGVIPYLLYKQSSDTSLTSEQSFGTVSHDR